MSIEMKVSQKFERCKIQIYFECHYLKELMFNTMIDV